MRVDVTGQGFNVTEALRDHIERRLEFAVARFEDHIDTVSVRLEDMNGPRGGVDKECRVHVKLLGLPSVIITQSAKDAYAAVDRAADRLGHTVARKLERAHEPVRRA